MTRKWKEGQVKKEQAEGIKRGRKIQELIDVDVGKQYLYSFKELGKKFRRSWVRISVTNLNEQKYLGWYLYIYRYKIEEIEVNNVTI
jgi:hypothetical protein